MLIQNSNIIALKFSIKLMKTLSFLTSFLALTSAAFSQTTLIGPGVRNGDFNDDTDPTDQRTFAQTPFWQNIPANQELVGTRSNLAPPSGTRNGQVSSAAGVVLGQSTEYSIVEGDSFSVSYLWRDAFQWDDAADRVRVSLFVTDDDTITGAQTILADTDSPLSTTDSTWEPVESNDFYIADATHVGKTVFISIDSLAGGTSRFYRLDDVVLTVGELSEDPVLQVREGDFIFGDLEHPGGSSTSKTVTFKNAGIENDLILESIALSAETASFFSLGNVPTDGAIIEPSEEFTVEVIVTGGAGFVEATGDLILTTSPASQSMTLPLSANLSSGAEVFQPGSILLVDYDDGLDNGIHEVSLLNGGFEDGMANQTLTDTPVWVSPFSPEGDSTVITLDGAPATGLLHAQASGFNLSAPGALEDRVMPAVDIPLTDWTIAAGDSLTIEFSAKSGTNWEGANIQIIVEVLNENGEFVFDMANGATGIGSRWASPTVSFLGDGSSYETFSLTTPEVQFKSPWIGSRARIRFLNNALRTTFVDIDNVSITGNFKQLQEGDPIDLAVTALSYDAESEATTIQFTDTGAASYAIESSLDLDFTGAITYPLDGSEDRTTVPGQIIFTFEDDDIADPQRFWRVVAN